MYTILVMASWGLCCVGYYYLIKPPEDWVSTFVIWLTWCNSLFALCAAVLAAVLTRVPVSSTTIRQIRATIPMSKVFMYMLVTTCLVYIQHIHGYNITSVVTLTGGASIVVFFVIFHFYHFKTRDTIDDYARFIDLVVRSWEKGDFDMVMSYIDQCSDQEIAEIVTEVGDRFGVSESRLLLRLID